MDNLNVIQYKKIAEIEHLLATSTIGVLELKNSFNKDIRMDIYDYFIGRLSTFRESNLKERDEMKIAAIQRFSSKHSILGNSFPVLKNTFESLELFFKNMKQFESEEKIVLKNNDWLKLFKEKIKV